MQAVKSESARVLSPFLSFIGKKRLGGHIRVFPASDANNAEIRGCSVERSVSSTKDLYTRINGEGCHGGMTQQSFLGQE